MFWYLDAMRMICTNIPFLKIKKNVREVNSHSKLGWSSQRVQGGSSSSFSSLLSSYCVQKEKGKPHQKRIDMSMMSGESPYETFKQMIFYCVSNSLVLCVQVFIDNWQHFVWNIWRIGIIKRSVFLFIRNGLKYSSITEITIVKPWCIAKAMTKRRTNITENLPLKTWL